MKKIVRISNPLDFLRSWNREDGTISNYDILIVESIHGIESKIKRIVDICYQLEDWQPMFNELKKYLTELAHQFFDDSHIIFDELNDLYVEMEWQLEEETTEEKDYFLDQVITVAPVIAAKMVSCFIALQQKVEFIDTRDIVVTDNSYMDGNILKDSTEKNITSMINARTEDCSIVMPADIGCSTENFGVSYKKGILEELLQ